MKPRPWLALVLACAFMCFLPACGDDEEGEGPGTDRVTDAAGDAVQDPVQDPVVDPVQDPVVDPVQDPVVDPVQDPVPDVTTDPVEDVPTDVLEDPDVIEDPTTDVLEDPEVVEDPPTDQLQDPEADPIEDLDAQEEALADLDAQQEEVEEEEDMGCVPVLELSWAECTDNIDNDCDGLTDWDGNGVPADRDDGCMVCPPPGADQRVAENTEAACSDGLDNDCDWFVDCADSDCDPATLAACVAETPTDGNCHDNIDNDSDGRTDCYERACAPDCWDTVSGDEDNPTTNCTDLLDNDRDGYIDCDDSECKGDEYCATPGAGEDTVSCSDGEDNDGDGMVDCQDFDSCYGTADCPPEETDAQCSDDIDNDFDGLVDCADRTCYRMATVSVCYDEPENTEVACGDDLDNDYDRAIDCADPQCAGTTACATPPAESCLIGDWTIEQHFSDREFTFPGTAYIPPGGYLILARDTHVTDMAVFWDIEFSDEVLFITGHTTVDTVPQINGAETYELYDDSSTPVLIDGPTVAMPDYTSGCGGCASIQRTGVGPDTWVGIEPVFCPDQAAPGTSALSAATVDGPVISEFSDASGSGMFIYEFVELFCGTAP